MIGCHLNEQASAHPSSLPVWLPEDFPRQLDAYIAPQETTLPFPNVSGQLNPSHWAFLANRSKYRVCPRIWAPDAPTRFPQSNGARVSARFRSKTAGFLGVTS